MKRSIVPILLASLLALIGNTARAQVRILIQIDVSSPSAVKFTATTMAPAYTYGNVSVTTFLGITLTTFFTSGVAAIPVPNSLDALSSVISIYQTDNPLPQASFDNLFAPDYRNLNLHSTLSEDPMAFSTGTQALSGEAIYDLSTQAPYLPDVGTIGDIHIGNYSGSPGTVLGQWEVVGAIPEPSTYAIFVGLAALGFVAWRRRRAT